MSSNLLLILGACVAGVVCGLFVYWIIITFRKKLRANQSRSMEGERQLPQVIAEDIGDPSPEQPLYEANHGSDIQRETDTETDCDWLNNEVREVSANIIKNEDDDWLNAGVEEVSAQVYKQQDDDWLNAEDNQSLEAVNEPSLNRAATNLPEIQIEQDGPILSITVTQSHAQHAKPEQTVINLRINVSSQDSAMKEDGLYEVEVTPSNQGLQDFMTVNPVDEPVNFSHALMDEISIRPVDDSVIENLDSDL